MDADVFACLLESFAIPCVCMHMFSMPCRISLLQQISFTFSLYFDMY